MPFAALVDGCVVMLSWLAGAGVPVAEKVTGLPVSPLDVAVRVFTPAVLPSVQLPTVATPLTLVVDEVPVALPPPNATAKVTATPLTALPLWSVTRTEGAVAIAAPTVPLWLLPALTAIVVAAPAVRAKLDDVAVVNDAGELKAGNGA